MSLYHNSFRKQFQSTPPIRETTLSGKTFKRLFNDFNPRLPYGRRRWYLVGTPYSGSISIHASHTGDDCTLWGHISTLTNFNPRLPYGRRQESKALALGVITYFNPRLPYGRRHYKQAAEELIANFNPRLPYGRRRDKFKAQVEIE